MKKKEDYRFRKISKLLRVETEKSSYHTRRVQYMLISTTFLNVSNITYTVILANVDNNSA